MISRMKRGCCTVLMMLLILIVGFTMCSWADETGSTAAGNGAQSTETQQNDSSGSAAGGETGENQSGTAEEEEQPVSDEIEIINEKVSYNRTSETYLVQDDAAFSIETGDRITVQPETMKKQKLSLTFKAEKDGLLEVGGENFSGTAQLKKKNGKAISNAVKFDTENVDYEDVHFGVSKGTTYVLCLSGKPADTEPVVDAETNEEQPVTFSVTVDNDAVSGSAGSSKSTAKAMKKRTNYKGVIEAGKGGADWYRINITSPQWLKISYKANTCGTLKFYFIGDGLEGKIHESTFKRKHEGLTGTVKSLSKVPKGTYYIKVVRSDEKSSGTYTLRWY